MLKSMAVLCLLSVALMGQPRVQPSGAELARIRAALPKTVQVKVSVPRKVLVYCDTMGYYHASIPYCTAALKMMGEATGAFAVSCVSADPSVFEPDNLKQFDVIFLNNNTSRSPFGHVAYETMPDGPDRLTALARDMRLKKALLDFVRNGKGLVGIHAATDALYDWPEYGDMVGGYFDGHPWHEKVGVELCDAGHPLMRGWQGIPFSIVEEIYQQKQPYSRDRQRVLMRLDTSRTNMTKKGIRRKDGDFALAWIKRYGRGRVAYLAFGHRQEVFWNTGVLTMLLDYIQYAAGDLKADDRPSNQVEPEYWEASAQRGLERGLKSLLEELRHYELGKTDEVARRLDAFANRLQAPGEAKRAQMLSRGLATLLDDSSSLDCRNVVLRQLSRLGNEDIVERVGEQLLDERTFDMALYCLRRMPLGRADEVLIKAVAQKPEKGRALLQILGLRGYAGAVPALSAWLKAGGVLSGPAARSLGDLPVAAAGQALLAALGDSRGTLRQDIYAGLWKLCPRLSGDWGRAVAQALMENEDVPVNMKGMGQGRWIALGGTGEIARGIGWLGRDALEICAPVAHGLTQVPGGLRTGLERIGAGVSATGARCLLREAEQSGDRSLEPLVVRLAVGQDMAVAQAALRALWALGGTSSVQPLLGLRGKTLEEAAEQALSQMAGTGVRETLEKELRQHALDDGQRARIVRILGRRKESEAAIYGPWILNGERQTAREALKAVSLIASERDAVHLAAWLRLIRRPSDRRRLEGICVSASPKGATLEAYVGRFLHELALSDDIKVRCSFLKVLGRFGHEAGLPMLMAGLKDPCSDIKREAILALTGWPTDAPLQALRTISQDQGATMSHRVLALRGYAQLLALPSSRPLADTLAMYREALGMATQPWEKQSLLAGLGKLCHPEAFALAYGYVKDPEVSSSATMAAAQILNLMGGASMRLTASHGGKTENAIDGDRSTRWTTGRMMRGGEWLMADLGYVINVNDLTLDAGDEGDDYPRGYDIYLSKDGRTWGLPVLTGRGTSRQMKLSLKGTGRFVKIVQTGSAERYWSVCELTVNGMPHGLVGATPEKNLRLKSSSGSERLGKMIDGVSGTRWDTGKAQQPGEWLTIELPVEAEVSHLVLDCRGSKDDYPRGYRVEVSSDGRSWTGPVALGQGQGPVVKMVLLPNRGRFVRITLTEGVRPFYWSIHELSVFVK